MLLYFYIDGTNKVRSFFDYWVENYLNNTNKYNNHVQNKWYNSKIIFIFSRWIIKVKEIWMYIKIGSGEYYWEGERYTQSKDDWI